MNTQPQLIQSTKHLRRRRGASVTEFLVAAPVLALLMYAALDLNQMLEFRQGLVVATRNAAFDRVGGTVHQNGSSQSLSSQVQPFLAPGAADDMGALSSVTNDSHGFANRHGFPSARAKSALDAGNRGEDQAFESASDTVGSVAATGNDALDRLTKLINLGGLAGDVWLLPPAAMRTVTGSMAETTGSSLVRRSMHLVSRAAENKQNPSIHNTPAMSHLLYLRPETGYHPDGYVVQPLAGYLLGMGQEYKKWGATGRSGLWQSPANYNHDCIMNFDGGGSRCTDTNAAFAMIRTTGMLIRALILAGEASVVLTLPALGIDAKTMAVRAIADLAATQIADFVADKIANGIEGAAGDALQNIGFPGQLDDPMALLNPGLSAPDFSLMDGFSRLTEFQLPQ
jgi:hypothetical protein